MCQSKKSLTVGRKYMSDDSSEYSSEGGDSFDGDELDSAIETAQERLKGATNRALPEPRESSIIYLGHVPHGFYEEQMNSFFSQFGTVKRLRLSRNKKTGRSKHYAFIEMESGEVASIVAETMNNYFLCGQKLVSHVIPLDKVHERMFVGANRKFRPIPWRTVARKRHNAPRTEAQQAKRAKRLSKQESKKRKRLAELGIEYDFVGYSAGAAATETDAAVERNTAKKKKSKLGKAGSSSSGKSSATPAKRRAGTIAKSKEAEVDTDETRPSKQRKTATPAKKAAKKNKSLSVTGKASTKSKGSARKSAK